MPLRGAYPHMPGVSSYGTTDAAMTDGLPTEGGPGGGMGRAHRFRHRQKAVLAITGVKAHPQFVYGAAWLAQFGETAELSDVTTAIRDDPVVPVQWAWFLLNKFGDEFDVESRAHFIAKAAQHEGQAMLAFALMRDAAWLTDEEDVALYAIWQGQLPAVEAEIAEGQHPRAKGVAWP